MSFIQLRLKLIQTQNKKKLHLIIKNAQKNIYKKNT